MRNVVLLCLDTVRQDYFAAFAPRLRERADVEFAQCRAASSWSAPSHASMFTERLPHRHGVHAHNRDFSGLSRADTFLGRLPDHRTVGLSANVWASSAFGFDGLFDEFSDVSPDRRFPEGIHVARFGQRCDREGAAKQVAFLREALAHDRPLRSLANGALVEFDNLTARAPVPKPLDDGARSITKQAFAAAEGDEPFFLFANVMDAHGPLRHIRGYDRSLHDAPLTWTSETVNWRETVARGETDLLERYKGLYGAAIDYLDRLVCDFADRIRAATDRETTVVVTSDHGDNLAGDADEGLWGHVESSLSEGLLHVPLVVLNAPGDGDRVVDDYVSHLRLGDLVVGLANGERPDVTEERVAAERVGHSGKAHEVEDVDAHHDRALRCVYDGTRKYEWDSLGGARTVGLDPDRPSWQATVDEAFDVDALEAEFFDEPLAAYKERVRDGAVAPEMDQVTADRLRDLGYL